MTDDELDAFAEALIEAHRTGSRFAPSGAVPKDRRDAYAIQSRVAEALGPVGGFKTAHKPGERSIMAPIFADDLVPSGGAVPVAAEIGVELEVGFRVVAPIPAEPSDDDLRRCLEPVAVIELVATRIDGALAEDPVVKLADNQANFGLVVGDTAPAWAGEDFAIVGASMRAGENVLVEGDAEIPGGSALASFRGLLAELGAHCGGLREGRIVITGTLHPLTYVPAGTSVRGRIDGIGTVRVDLEPKN